MDFIEFKLDGYKVKHFKAYDTDPAAFKNYESVSSNSMIYVLKRGDLVRIKPNTYSNATELNGQLAEVLQDFKGRDHSNVVLYFPILEKERTVLALRIDFESVIST